MPVYDEAAPRLWPAAAAGAPFTVPLQRLRSHSLHLSDGHRIGVTVGGRGIPLVVAHGFSFAGGLYVQSLSRLASMGFRVLAVDLAGHGGSAGLGVVGATLAADTIQTLFLSGDQGLKLQGLAIPQATANA